MSDEQPTTLYKFCEVVFPVPVDHAFTYAIPEPLRPILKPGFRVLAPFGRRTLTGFVVDLKYTTDFSEPKEIYDILDEEPLLSTEMLQLTQFISEYYMAPWGEVIDASLPSGIQLESKRVVRLNSDIDREKIQKADDLSVIQKDILLFLLRKGKQLVTQLENKFKKSNLNYNVLALQDKGWLTISRELLKPSVRPKKQKFVRLADHLTDPASLTQEIGALLLKNSRQADLLKELQRRSEGLPQADLLRRAKVSYSTLKAAVRDGRLVVEERELFRDYYNGVRSEKPEELFVLNPSQEAALKTLIQYLESGKFTPVMLYGVTGSGKTQVYIDVLKEVRRRGRTAIVLVPEIALTPQTVSRFRAHFDGDIAVLHSRMSEGERYDSWRKIKRGEVNIVIGPRSALFAPLKNIGLIVVDEEHESSYKQSDTSPRYHARDVALVRGKMNQALVILGSATPSIETYYNAYAHKYHIITMEHRVHDLPLPKVEIVDMRKEWQQYHGKPSAIISHRLIEKISEKLSRREQVILFLNRRGFSTFILCRDCGFVEHCQHCNITLTYHIYEHHLRCHYCNFNKPAPEICPNCGGYQLVYKGTGTQRVEEELKLLFPKIRVVRMDMDTTSRKGAHDQILNDFRDGLYEVLLGTQMVAKGLDFPNVSLVGVISADITLQLPDFRSSERTFQLLTQVAGRSGRKTQQGEVIVQTYNPQNHSIIFAKRHDYLRFFRYEIEQRKELAYPPFSRLIKLEFKHKDEAKCAQVAEWLARTFQDRPFYRLVGPAPAPLSRLKEEYRYHLIIKYDKKQDPTGSRTRQEISRALQKCPKKLRHGVKIIIDVDPVDLF